VPNITTALFKDAILMAAEVAGGGEPDGLVKYLVAQAEFRRIHDAAGQGAAD
jgi:hypothetical protein